MLTHGQLTFVMNNYLCDVMPATTAQDVSLVVGYGVTNQLRPQLGGRSGFCGAGRPRAAGP
jgi:hypothetical protein